MNYVTERYNHLKKCFGAQDPFVQGYAECMRMLKMELKMREKNKAEASDGNM